MAKIFEGGAVMTSSNPNDTQFTRTQANRMIRDYWSGIGERHLFVATLALLDHLFSESTAIPKKIALRIVRIDNPETVKGKWISYSGVPDSEDDERDDVSYYIINEQQYSGQNGLRHGSRTEAITGRIGIQNNHHFVFFYATDLIFGRPGGTGNSAGTPGVKVPPGQ